MQVPLAEAATHLSELAARAEAGEEIVLTRGDAPSVRLVVDRRKPTSAEKRAVLERFRGVAKGKPEWQGVTAATASDFLYDKFGLPA
jgi:antitoxin (DNA-binding transcriptional repressor) of toxin-antitoxin stability system